MKMSPRTRSSAAGSGVRGRRRWPCRKLYAARLNAPSTQEARARRRSSVDHVPGRKCGRCRGPHRIAATADHAGVPQRRAARVHEHAHRRLGGDGGHRAAGLPGLRARGVPAPVRHRRRALPGRRRAGPPGQRRAGGPLAALQGSGRRRLRPLGHLQGRAPRRRQQRRRGVAAIAHGRPHRQGHPHRAARRADLAQLGAGTARRRLRAAPGDGHRRRDARPARGLRRAAGDPRRFRRAVRRQPLLRDPGPGRAGAVRAGPPRKPEGREVATRPRAPRSRSWAAALPQHSSCWARCSGSRPCDGFIYLGMQRRMDLDLAASRCCSSAARAPSCCRRSPPGASPIASAASGVRGRLRAAASWSTRRCSCPTSARRW